MQTAASRTPGSASGAARRLHSRMRCEDDFALKHRPGKIGLAAGSGDLTRGRPGRTEVDDDPAREDLRAQMRDLLLVTAVKAVGNAQQPGQLLHPEPFGRRECGEILVFEVRQTFAMITGHLCHEIHRVPAEMLPAVLTDDAGRFTMMALAGRRGAPSDVVQRGCGLQDEAVMVTQ